MGAIIWLASYPKSGNTWMRAFLHNLLLNQKEPVSINDVTRFCFGEAAAVHFNRFDRRPLSQLTDQEIAQLRPKVHELLTRAYPDSVFVKTHNYLGDHEGVPLITMRHTAGAIYMVRNPLDVAISFSHHFGLELTEAIEQLAHPGIGTATTDRNAQQVYGSWSLNVKSWTQQQFPTLHVVRYEDMTGQPIKTFSGVAGFLGLSPPRERLDRAIANSSFEVLKAQEEETGFTERTEHSRFFRQGRIEQWKEVLSEDQVGKIVSDHREQMERFGYVPEGY
ncbi:MAG: sulfotransferase domain-containing protein [Gammaproteobacteria bacterium]|nr:sulfotransferase domain-containing protein [Gammaproteobacteria bacterium]